MRALAAVAWLALAAPALAQDPAAALGQRMVEEHIRPAYASFRAAADRLSPPAQACDADGLRAGYHGAFDAWMAAQHVAFGPVQAESRRFAVVFWPDERGAVRRGLDRLIARQDPVVEDAGAFAAASAAVRGLSALERLLWTDRGARDWGAGDDDAYLCRVAQAIAVSLSGIASDLVAGWTDGADWPRWISAPGGEGNSVFLTSDDVAREVFRSLDSGLETIAALRLGGPLGTFERPRPRRAEAWRSGRSMRNIRLSLAAQEKLFGDVVAPELAPELAEDVMADFARARTLADRAPDSFQSLADGPAARPRFEAIQSRVRDLQRRIRAEVAPPLGVIVGFNALDGD